MQNQLVSESPLAASDGPKPKPERLRILHSVGHLARGGIEMWLYQTIKKLDKDRFEHHVMVRTDKEESFSEDFRKAGARVLPCLDHTNPLKYACNFRNLVRRNGPYDILHIHGSNPNGLQAGFLARRLGIPRIIVHSHNDLRPLLEKRGIFYRSYVALTLKGLRLSANQGIAASVLAAESMFGDSWRTNPKWRLLYCGINFSPFATPPDPELRSSLGIPEDAFVIGHVGRFHKQKNHEFMVKILEQVVLRDKQAHLLLVGDGQLRSEIASSFSQHGLSKYVTFVPDSTSVPLLMRSVMDCFLFPSIYEGLGLVAVEAQAAGLPCFLSDRVPEEASVDSALVTVLSLQQPPQVWADSILRRSVSKIAGVDHLNLFRESRFNLDTSASLLAEMYLRGE